MIFQQTGVDEWVEMSRICLGLLMKLSHHPKPAIVAMATAKLHTILQARSSEDLHELGYLMFSINKALNTAIESKFARGGRNNLMVPNGNFPYVFRGFTRMNCMEF